MRTAIVAASLLLSACTYGGHYARSGPCEGWHTDQAACVRAHENSVAISRVQIGQSIEDVREIMGKGPERRDATSATEIWGYRTNYAEHLVTTIFFTDGMVTEIQLNPSAD